MAKRARRAAATRQHAGPLSLRVGSSAGHVGVDFGGPVVRFSLPAAEARKLAATLLVHADKADGGGLAAP